MEVVDRDELVIISTQGMVIRQSVKDLRVMGRNTQGVRVIRLNEHDSIADIARVVPEDDEEVKWQWQRKRKRTAVELVKILLERILL